MSFIERERDKLNTWLQNIPIEHPGRGAVEAAQQALSWALEPDAFASPSATLNKFFSVGDDELTKGTGVIRGNSP